MPLAAALPYIIGGATSVYGANQAKKGVNAQVEASNAASALEQQSADKQLALQREIWEKQQADYKPYLEQGTWGINRLGDLMRNRTPIGNPSTPFYNYASNEDLIRQDNALLHNQSSGTTPFNTYAAGRDPETIAARPTTPTAQPAFATAPVAKKTEQPYQWTGEKIDTSAWFKPNSQTGYYYGDTSVKPLSFGLDGANVMGNGRPDPSQPTNPLIPNYDVFNTVPNYGLPVAAQQAQQAQAQQQPQQRYQTNANGGFLNNPLDSYLASKGVSNKFDPSNTRLSSLMSQGSGQLNNPFDTYLASKGLAGGKFDTNNPAYQFQLKQGQQALDRSSAARGMGYSGAQMKASQEYGQGLASQQYDKEYNRASGEFSDYYRMAGNEYDRANQQHTNEYNRASGEFGDYFNRLSGLAQGGQQATASLQNAGSQYANSASNTFGNLSNAQTGILGQQANARASGYSAKSNALSAGLNSLTNLYGMSQYGGGKKNTLGSWLNSDM